MFGNSSYATMASSLGVDHLGQPLGHPRVGGAHVDEPHLLALVIGVDNGNFDLGVVLEVLVLVSFGVGGDIIVLSTSEVADAGQSDCARDTECFHRGASVDGRACLFMVGCMKLSLVSRPEWESLPP